MTSQAPDAVEEGDPDLERTLSKGEEGEGDQMDQTMRSDMDQTMRTNDPEKLNIEENQDDEGD